MAEVQGRLTPQTGFIVAAASDFVRFDQATFIDFYQPLLSPTALGLFYALQSQLKPDPMLTKRQAHSIMLDRLNLGIAQFAEARNALEGVEMLQTFYQQDEIGGVFVYVLQPTMTPEEFINDDLLSVRLLQQIGEQRFNELVAHSRRYQFDTSRMHNLTHDYFEVFKPDRAAWDAERPTLNNARATAVQKSNSIKAVPQNDFDFGLLLSRLENRGVDLQSVKDQRRLILTESLMYGIGALEMADLVFDATDFRTSMLQPNILKQRIAAKYAGTLRQNGDPAPVVAAGDENLDGLGETERNLIKVARENSPNDFLAGIKQSVGAAYVSPNERNTVLRMIENSGMPNEVINILINYMFVEKEYTTLKSGLADGIINAWTKAGVKTAADAIREIKKHRKNNEKQAGAKPRRRYYSSGRSNINEELPEWAKHPEKVKNKKPSAEKLAKIDQMLAELNQQKNNPGTKK